MRFLHPNAAYLFLLLIPLLALSLRKPIAKTVVVPSLSFWKSTMGDEKTERNKSGFFFPPLSFMIFLGGMGLLIVALMTPIPSRVHLPDTVNTLAIQYTCDLPESVQRVLDLLDDMIPLKEGVVIPEGTPILTVYDVPCDPETKGNILIIAKTSESEETDACRFSYDVILSDPDREVVLLSYSSADMKSVQFPIKIAEAVDHFRREGVLSPPFRGRKEENISLWFAAAAGIVILSAFLISKK